MKGWRHTSKYNPVLTRRKFESLFGLTQATAGRYMAKLVKEGKLKNISTYYHPIYVPEAGYYGAPAQGNDGQAGT